MAVAWMMHDGFMDATGVRGVWRDSSASLRTARRSRDGQERFALCANVPLIPHEAA
jgi:hypothetical protein